MPRSPTTPGTPGFASPRPQESSWLAELSAAPPDPRLVIRRAPAGATQAALMEATGGAFGGSTQLTGAVDDAALAALLLHPFLADRGGGGRVTLATVPQDDEDAEAPDAVAEASRAILRQYHSDGRQLYTSTGASDAAPVLPESFSTPDLYGRALEAAATADPLDFPASRYCALAMQEFSATRQLLPVPSADTDAVLRQGVERLQSHAQPAASAPLGRRVHSPAELKDQAVDEALDVLGGLAAEPAALVSWLGTRSRPCHDEDATMVFGDDPRSGAPAPMVAAGIASAAAALPFPPAFSLLPRSSLGAFSAAGRQGSAGSLALEMQARARQQRTSDGLLEAPELNVDAALARAPLLKTPGRFCAGKVERSIALGAPKPRLDEVTVPHAPAAPGNGLRLRLSLEKERAKAELQEQQELEALRSERPEKPQLGMLAPDTGAPTLTALSKSEVWKDGRWQAVEERPRRGGKKTDKPGDEDDVVKLVKEPETAKRGRKNDTDLSAADLLFNFDGEPTPTTSPATVAARNKKRGRGPDPDAALPSRPSSPAPGGAPVRGRKRDTAQRPSRTASPIDPSVLLQPDTSIPESLMLAMSTLPAAVRAAALIAFEV